MNKPRIFLGSSGKQAKLLQAITRGLAEVADVEPWTTTFNPGRNTLDRLVELSQEVDFAAFVFAQDDWTTKGGSPDEASGEASPRDNVVFESPTDMKSREQLADVCVTRLGIKLPAVVDRFDDSTETAYSGWPDRLYVIDAGGKIAYKSKPGPFGFKPAEMEAALRALLPAPPAPRAH